MSFRVRLHPHDAAPVLRSMPPAAKRAAKEALRALREDPFAFAARADVKELSTTGGPRMFRIRVRSWRLVYQIRAEVVDVIKVFHRRDGYGWMDRLLPPYESDDPEDRGSASDGP